MNKKITNSDFSKNIEFKIDKEELRILKLQKEYKSGNINEENISDDDYFKLVDLYKKQNEKLKQKIKSKKKKIRENLDDLKDS